MPEVHINSRKAWAKAENEYDALARLMGYWHGEFREQEPVTIEMHYDGDDGHKVTVEKLMLDGDLLRLVYENVQETDLLVEDVLVNSVPQ